MCRVNNTSPVQEPDPHREVPLLLSDAAPPPSRLPDFHLPEPKLLLQRHALGDAPEGQNASSR
eukprot:4149583-Alexandrium_andersonii.AAC.1